MNFMPPIFSHSPWLGWLAALMLINCFGNGLSAQRTDPPRPVMAEGYASGGTAQISPEHGVAGEFGVWTVRFKVGEEGIEEGGGIRVQLPDSWHFGPRNSGNRLQATDPSAAHFISASVSRPGVGVKTIVESQTDQELVKHAKDSLDGRFERYVFVVRVWVTKGRLEEGDVIAVTYGDRSGGSPGMLASGTSTDPEPLLIALDTKGEGNFHLIASAPQIQAIPGDPAELLFHSPSQAVPGEPVRLLIAILDKEYNAVRNRVRISLSQVTGSATFPSVVEVPAGNGYIELEVTPTAPGILRLKAEAPEFNLSGVSNPMAVTTELPERKVYWGDLHSHARHSWDGVGNASFEYARYITGLDFYALTDHAIAPPGENRTRGLSEHTWAEYTALTDKYHSPPHFVTLHGYEASFGPPYGHHNVYFRNQPGPLVYPQQTSLEELWQMLEVGDALTIPHHTGKFPGGIELDHHDPVFRRNFEIYSAHGLSERYDPAHPLSFEKSTFTSPSRSVQAPTFAQDAWSRGLVLSTIASSDDHRGQPGQPHYGLAAVRAPDLTRDDIFQSLYDRHTYGTSGARILLDFSLNGVPMGQRVKVNGSPLLEVRASGISQIERVEILKWQTPMEDFSVIKTWHPNALDFSDEYRDEEYEPGAIYYVRLRETEKIRDHLVKAWSSPIWTEGDILHRHD